jgi:predicted nucleic acid-binding protein
VKGVVDAGVAVEVLLRTERGQRARALLRGATLCAPELIDVEVTSVLRRLVRESKLEASRASEALQALAVWSFRRIRHRALLDEMWVLREILTAYDAAYVATAIRYQATVFTIDGPLTRMPKPPVQIVHLR